MTKKIKVLLSVLLPTSALVIAIPTGLGLIHSQHNNVPQLTMVMPNNSVDESKQIYDSQDQHKQYEQYELSEDGFAKLLLDALDETYRDQGFNYNENQVRSWFQQHESKALNAINLYNHQINHRGKWFDRFVGISTIVAAVATVADFINNLL